MRAFAALNDFDKPIVAAVQRVAVGFGTTMLVHCDFVYAGESARFITPFIDLALVPEMGSSYGLPALVGWRPGRRDAPARTPFGAGRAEQLGLVTAVVPDQDVLETPTQAAQKLGEKPAAALRASKKLLKRQSASTSPRRAGSRWKNSPCECARGGEASVRGVPPQASARSGRVSHEEADLTSAADSADSAARPLKSAPVEVTPSIGATITSSSRCSTRWQPVPGRGRGRCALSEHLQWLTLPAAADACGGTPRTLASPPPSALARRILPPRAGPPSARCSRIARFSSCSCSPSARRQAFRRAFCAACVAVSSTSWSGTTAVTSPSCSARPAPNGVPSRSISAARRQPTRAGSP